MPSPALLLASAAMAVIPPPKLSEIRADSLPPLANVEYIELMGVAGTALDGYSVVVIGDEGSEQGPALGNSGVVESAVSLAKRAIPADRAFLIHSSGLLPPLPDLVADCRLEDNDNLTVLLVRDCTALPGDDLDLDDDGTLDIAPWSEVVDGVSLVWWQPGVSSEWTYAPAQAGPNGGIFIFQARRCLDTDAWTLGPWSYSANPNEESAGLANPPCGGVLCGGDVNGDGLRDSADLAAILSNWDRLGTTADLDGNGFVGPGDLTVLLSLWGPCDL